MILQSISAAGRRDALAIPGCDHHTLVRQLGGRSPPSARDGFEHLGGVAIGAHVVPGALDPPVRTHEKRRPDDSQGLAPVQRLRPKGAIKRHHLMVRVAQEGDLQPVLGPEFLVLGAAVGRDA